MDFKIQVANYTHLIYVHEICTTIEHSAKMRGTGIAKRDSNYIKQKIKSNNAVIALLENTFVGFCYIETWEHAKYVANSGLIVAEKFRGFGIAKKIKTLVFNLARNKFPDAKIFGITTSLPVMKINSSLGYDPVTFSELPKDSTFWESCNSCPNFDILTRNNKEMCLCTGMLAPSKNSMEHDLSYLISKK